MKKLFAVLAALTAFSLAIPITQPAADAATTTKQFTGTVDANGEEWGIHDVKISGPSSVKASVKWSNNNADLSLFAKDPSGDSVGSATTNKEPEVVTFDAKKGTYKVKVKAKTGKSSYTLTVDITTESGSADYSGNVSANGAVWGNHELKLTEKSDVEVTLDWSNSAADLNLFVKDNNGNPVASATTNKRPEIVNFTAPAGTYKLKAKANSGSSAYTIDVEVSSSGSGGSGGGGGTSGGNGTVGTWAPDFMLGAHNPTEAEAVAAAKKFDVIAALKGPYRKHVKAMKAANPNLTLLVYMNGLYARGTDGNKYPSNWYSYDAKNKKIRSNNFGNYLMNPTKTGWRNNRIDECKEFLAYSGYDGCLVDMLGVAPLGKNYGTGQPINTSTGKVWTEKAWLAQTSALAKQIKNANNVVTMGNGLGNGDRYFDGTDVILDAIDGAMSESFVRSGKKPLSNIRSEAKWKEDVDMLVDASARGDSVLAVTKTWTSGSNSAKDAVHKYALASFLLGDNGTSRFMFIRNEGDNPTKWNSLWDTDLGNPQGSYYKKNNLFVRDFKDGMVVVNPTGSTHSMSLGGSYVTIGGASKSSITLKANTAEIFLKP